MPDPAAVGLGGIVRLRPDLGDSVTQIRNDTPGRVYFQRKLADGKSKKEALRALKRRISDAVWRRLPIDLKLP
jgi:hypothetical protein